MTKTSSRKADIILQAATLFNANGFSATSVAEIAAACEITKSTLFHHFTGKMDIARHAVNAVVERSKVAIFSATTPINSSQPGYFQALADLVTQFFQEAPSHALIHVLSPELKSNHPEITPLFNEYHDTWLRTLQLWLEPYLDATQQHALAHHTFMLIHSAVSLNRSFPEKYSPEQLNTQLVQLWQQACSKSAG